MRRPLLWVSSQKSTTPIPVPTLGHVHTAVRLQVTQRWLINLTISVPKLQVIEHFLLGLQISFVKITWEIINLCGLCSLPSSENVPGKERTGDFASVKER